MIRRNFLLRGSQLALLGILIAVTAGATDSSARFDKDSHEMMCVCGCNQLLGECNHVGCPDSEGMRVQLAASIAKGDSDNDIFHQFQEQYGPVVLAAPRFTRFNHLAWIWIGVVIVAIGTLVALAPNLSAALAAQRSGRPEPRIEHEPEVAIAGRSGD